MRKSFYVFCFLLTGTVLLAKGIWGKKPYTEWSEQEALRVYRYSPWVEERGFFGIRLQSAEIMRMALARLAVLSGNVSEEDAAHFVKTRPYDGKIVVVVGVADGALRSELNTTGGTEFLKRETYLHLKKSKSRIDLKRYVAPTEAGGMEGFFLFPREKDGGRDAGRGRDSLCFHVE